MKKKRTEFIVKAAVIAALYAALTLLSFGLSSGMIQCRISEALCVLAAYTPAAIPGLAVGCVLGNILSGCAVWDVVFGSLATLIGAVLTYALRRRKYLAAVPPVIANTLIVPPVLMLVYGLPQSYALLTVCVFAGELISCALLGTLLVRAFETTASGKYIKKFLENGVY